jgi:hypothetical protein
MTTIPIEQLEIMTVEEMLKAPIDGDITDIRPSMEGFTVSISLVSSKHYGSVDLLLSSDEPYFSCEASLPEKAKRAKNPLTLATIQTAILALVEGAKGKLSEDRMNTVKRFTAFSIATNLGLGPKATAAICALFSQRGES